MQVATDRDSPDVVDPSGYLRHKEEYKEKKHEFMRKYLRRMWPKRILRILGVFQLLISLVILGVDLPIILMFAPRWQVFAGCWTFIFGFMACISTFHSTRKMTWSKLKWAAGFNIVAGVAAAIMIAFDVLFSVNPYICLISGGCNYLWYTYSIVKSIYIGEILVGIALFITVFIFLMIFIKHGIGGTILFENITKGRASDTFSPIVTQNPRTGSGIAPARRPPLLPPPPPPPHGYMPRYPPPPPPHGYMPRYPPPNPGAMMTGPPGSMMVSGPRGPMMVPGPRGPGGPMMVPGPGVPMQGYYRQPGPHPPSAHRYQN